MCPERLRFPDSGGNYTPEQVIQRSIEAHMNGGRHGNPREPLAEFIANELRLHGFADRPWDLDDEPSKGTETDACY
jgi:hypothetical protein